MAGQVHVSLQPQVPMLWAEVRRERSGRKGPNLVAVVERLALRAAAHVELLVGSVAGNASTSRDARRVGEVVQVVAPVARALSIVSKGNHMKMRSGTLAMQAEQVLSEPQSASKYVKGIGFDQYMPSFEMYI